MTKIVTENDMTLFNFIKEYVEEHGYAPSIREMMEGLGYASTSTIHGKLTRLYTLGLIETDYEGSPRAIRLKGYKLVKVETGE